jgi:predicted nucleotidyltransferase
MEIPLDEARLVRELRRHAVGTALVFGSRARGTARPDSDLDVAVLRADGRPLTQRELGALKRDLEEASPVPVDVVDLRAADALVRFEVFRDGFVVLRDSDDLLRELLTRTLIEHDDIAPFLPALVAGVGRAGGPPEAPMTAEIAAARWRTAWDRPLIRLRADVDRLRNHT